MTTNDREELLERAAAKEAGLLRELGGFLMQTKKWWLAPILLCILLFGLMIFLSGTAAAPFMYTLF